MSSRNIDISLKMGFSPSKSFVLFSSMKAFKNDDFTSKSFFVPKIFKDLSLLFRHVEKTAWLERKGKFQNLWRHSLVNKQ